MDEKPDVTRRDFIKAATGAAVVVAAPTIVPRSAFGANDRIRAAVLGVNGRGRSHIEQRAGVRVKEMNMEIRMAPADAIPKL